jgi:excinuclease ABC subunit C
MEKDFKTIVKTFPQLPGVYVYRDETGEVIYVGKAKNLRSRVGSYFHTALDRYSKTYALVQRINDIQYIVVDNEFGALILEATLIKKHLPKYNIVLKDDKSFLYIVVKKGIYSKILISRKTNLDSKDKNYGPFTNSTVTKQVVRILRKIFPYRDCSESKFQRYRKMNTPCLYGHINLCPSPCVDLSDSLKKQYKNNIKKIEKVLSGDSSKLIRDIENKMKSFSKEKRYEEAVKYRDLLQKFNYVRANYREASEYLDNPYLIDDRNKEALQTLQSLIPSLKQIPNRIECYDISNISGKEGVGSMVVATDGKIDKSEYRRFKIRFKDTPDDVDMLYDVVSRRFNKDWEHPGLLVVDGGKPQVSAAQRALEDMNVSCTVIGLAKKFETIVVKEGNNFKEINVEKTNSGLRLLIVLRDEAHRFAQSYHHLLRLKSLGV